jgi:hypothetical protein
VCHVALSNERRAPFLVVTRSGMLYRCEWPIEETPTEVAPTTTTTDSATTTTTTTAAAATTTTEVKSPQKPKPENKMAQMAAAVQAAARRGRQRQPTFTCTPLGNISQQQQTPTIAIHLLDAQLKHQRRVLATHANDGSIRLWIVSARELQAVPISGRLLCGQSSVRRCLAVLPSSRRRRGDDDAVLLVEPSRVVVLQQGLTFCACLFVCNFENG